MLDQPLDKSALRDYLRTRLKTRHLLLVVALDEEGSIHRAAERLAMTQPAASKMLRELEELVEAPLFERLPRGVRPTPYGLALIRHAGSVARSLDQARDDLQALKGGTHGQVALGAITAPAVGLMPQALAAVKQRYGGMRLSLEIDTSNVLLERLAQDRLDLVVGRLAAGHDQLALRYEPLGLEPVCAVVRPGHPLLSAPGLDLPALVDCGWIVPPAGSVLRHRFNLMFQRASLPLPANTIETAALLFTTRLLEHSDMVAVLAEEVARYYAAYRMLEILPVSLPCHMDDFGIITRVDLPLSPAAALVADILRSTAASRYADGRPGGLGGPPGAPR